MSAGRDPAPVSAARAGGGVALFVRRPILAFVLSALIVIAGLASLLGVEVRELPDVDRPVLTVTTRFDGASPETIDREITAPIEGAIGRVQGVKAISSTSRFGRSRVTAEFGDAVDLDVAATDARDAVARIRNSLPDDAEDPRIVKADDNADAVMRIGVTSPTRSVAELTEMVENEVEDRLIAVPGVADVQVNGARELQFRVDIDQRQMASRGLTLAELRAALANAAFDSPAGEISSRDQSIVVRATAAVATPEEFEAIMLGDGVAIGDVASVTLGPDPGASVLRANSETGIGLGIVRQAQSNTLDISAGVRRAVDELNGILPEDVRVFVTSDEAAFITGAIREVALALFFAVTIVIAVIYLFLRDWRATLIPAVSIPVALIGTLAAIYLAGFSVNILTLLALVLATGLVVDDAIVVVENIVRRRAEGMGPRAAAVIGTRQVFFAVIATTATLAAVFVPISFLPGQAGGLFREFGFTLAISVTLSAVVALTLCPVMAARFLRPADVAPKRGLIAALGAALATAYRRSLHRALDAPLVVVATCVMLAATAWFAFGGVKRELTPPEDRAMALASVRAPQGVSLDYTTARMAEVENLLAPLRASGEITNVFLIAGVGDQPNRGFIVLTLADWADRARSQAEIVVDVNAALRRVVGIQAFAIQPNSLGIRGAGRGLQFAVLGANYAAIAAQAETLAERMRAEAGAFDEVTVSYEPNQPQLFVEVDRRRASDLGIEIDGLGQALQGMLDGAKVATAFIDDASYDVRMVSTSTPVNDPSDLENIFVRTASGAMVPISTIVSLEERAVPPELGREQQQRAVSVTATLRPGVALGDALHRAEALAAEVLPEGTRIVPLAEAATLAETNASLLITFGAAILVVFLVLAAQFESFVSALIVMATVPLGLACAVFALLMTGTSLNLYSQIGIVLLAGVMAKNGILIVEFADQLRDAGRSVREAIEEGTLIRLRPVMMTMAATVLGGVPLIFAHGAGAEAREALGWMIVGGLGVATLATLYVTPVAYLLLAGLAKPRAAESRRLADELAAASAA
ncbi:efflux RND transporter permease subunit [Amaricoccus sp.]|uniref:efflux RND transporter permease subunit n=1 Tax=Amaricoccus sp. TaxID=1872485 RepID=UPI001B459A4D|nr:efflux RND transporter permease subunit [Amaricoccus sp.]MBP7242617.1 efflux RND transporter permease subunit [Amaricoccus sp.]